MVYLLRIGSPYLNFGAEGNKQGHRTLHSWCQVMDGIIGRVKLQIAVPPPRA